VRREKCLQQGLALPQFESIAMDVDLWLLVLLEKAVPRPCAGDLADEEGFFQEMFAWLLQSRQTRTGSLFT
jgi:hypothetical protein